MNAICVIRFTIVFVQFFSVRSTVSNVTLPQNVKCLGGFWKIWFMKFLAAIFSSVHHFVHPKTFSQLGATAVLSDLEERLNVCICSQCNGRSCLCRLFCVIQSPSGVFRPNGLSPRSAQSLLNWCLVGIFSKPVGIIAPFHSKLW